MLWSHGYNADQGYTYGYYKELDPAWLDLCTIFKGITPPSIWANERLRYLELGCGQGLNLCLIAACNPQIEFVGIDFNPQHIAHARQLVRLSGLPNITFIEADFFELSKEWPNELGKFHYITAHGVLSWISSEISKAFFKCIFHASKSGTIVHISYNTLPGWLFAIPIQHLLKLWQDRESISDEKVFEIGYQRLMKLIEKNTYTTRALPTLKNKVENLIKHDKAYLIQEYLHDEWRPLWFDQVAKDMANIKLSYVGTANTADWFIYNMLPQEWKEIIEIYHDQVIKETILDVVINQNFRRDIWIRGGIPLWPGIHRERLLAAKFVLLDKPTATNENESPYKFRTSLGEIVGKKEVYTPLYEALSEGPKSTAELLNTSKGNENTQPRTLGDVLQAIGFMLSAGHIAILRQKDEKAEKNIKQLNRVITEFVYKGAPYRYLIASNIQTVVHASDVDMMLSYLKFRNPKGDQVQIGTLLAEQLRNLGKGLIKDGKHLFDFESIKNRSIELAEIFLNKTYPNWQNLGIT